MTTTSAPARRRSSRLLAVLLVLIGVLILLYPVAASQWNNLQQTRVARQYERDLQQVEPAHRDAAIDSAHKYNQAHAGLPILDPWLTRLSKDNVDYQEYLKELAGQPAMSQVVIPAINSRLPIYHGSDQATLQRGIGHLYGTALPVGGLGTHTVLTGHTGLTNATLWDNLSKVKEGDSIYITTFGERLKYEVDSIEVVLPNETDSLQLQEGKDLITLITCTPYGINSHRLLVHGHRVPIDAGDEQVLKEATGIIIQWWMWAVLALVLAIIAGLVTWLRKNKKKEADHGQM